MQELDKVSLRTLGRRIMIIGPSNAGKSTLCYALGKKLNLPSYHLDQIQHIAYTNWQARPREDFIKDHDALIAKDSWVMDGNYSIAMPQRLKRATAIIWIKPNLISCVWRYIGRCIKGKKGRFGGLEGAKKEFSFQLLHYMIFGYPPKNKKYKNLINEFGGNKPFIMINSIKELNKYYKFWQIERP